MFLSFGMNWITDLIFGTRKKTRIILDCDPGTDDAQAIMMCLAHPDVQLAAVTTCTGNATIDHTTKNALRVLKQCGRLDVPVYKGCEVTVVGKVATSDGFHGKDGLGDVVLPEVDPVDTRVVRKDHAAVAMTRLASQSPGPLTNIALALHLDPNFWNNLKDFFVMGGNEDGRGNVTQSAEFNTYCDPEATQFIFNRFGKKFYLADISVCMRHSWTWEEYDKFIKTPCKKAKFIETIDKTKVEKQRAVGAPGYDICDQFAVAASLDPTIMTETKEVYASVELAGDLTRGQVVVDWNNKSNKKPNVILISKVDQEQFNKMMYNILKD